MLEIKSLARRAMTFKRRLEQRKAAMPVDFPWYPWGTLDNFVHLDHLLSGLHRDLGALIGAGTAVDIGAADGDLAFFMEEQGVPMHVLDNPPTNYNGCRALHALRTELNSNVRILEADLDSQFALPQASYRLAFFLGILYHLKNPFFVLEALAKSASYALISTRIASHNLAAADATAEDGQHQQRFAMRNSPVAYLLAPDECNNDATNYWIFSETGLKRILQRSGWDVLDFITVGAVGKSDPATAAGDERAFCLVKSRYL